MSHSRRLARTEPKRMASLTSGKLKARDINLHILVTSLMERYGHGLPIKKYVFGEETFASHDRGWAFVVPFTVG